jgi:hypothetical protein
MDTNPFFFFFFFWVSFFVFVHRLLDLRLTAIPKFAHVRNFPSGITEVKQLSAADLEDVMRVRFRILCI